RRFSEMSRYSSRWCSSILMPCCRWLFFFQAEDGIRDRNVTGVQTCALPISLRYLVGCRVRGGVRSQRSAVRSDAVSSDLAAHSRSEERRVGKECGCWGGRWHGEYEQRGEERAGGGGPEDQWEGRRVRRE